MVKILMLILILGLLSCIEQRPGTPFSNANSLPQVLAPGVISTKESHESINGLTNNSRLIYFTRSDKNFETSTLYYSEFVDGEFTQPKILPFSGVHYDAGIHFSPNNKEAFFTSKRNPNNPYLSTEWNIWRTKIDQNLSWGRPEVLPAGINSASLECCLTMNNNGITFFASNRDGSWDIYEATYSGEGFKNVKKLSSNVNSENGEWPSYVNESGDLLLISSIRKTGFGGDDIYITRKKGGEWTNPVLLDSAINSSSYEDSPLISADEKCFLFSTWKDNEFSKGMSNIYYSKLPDAIK